MNEFHCFENEEERNHYLGDKISCEEQYLCELEKFIKSGYRLIEYQYNCNDTKILNEISRTFSEMYDSSFGLERLDYLDLYVKNIHDRINTMNIP